MIELIDREKPLSLYIHVPFCSSKCSYCAFYSEPQGAWNKSIIERYTDLISNQIGKCTEKYPHPFHTVYIGGGNPGKLGEKNLLKILEKALSEGKPDEVTVELNPEDVGPWISSMEGIVDRISIGIQSMNEKMLSFLGRNATLKENMRALETLSSSRFSFNADIITSVPGFSVEDTLDDIHKVSLYDPDHISFYSLVYEEGTKFYPLYEKRDEEYEEKCLREGWHLLKELGYRHYEVSNFAKPGNEAKHNLVYWNLGAYIGLGPGAEGRTGRNEVYTIRSNQDVFEFLEKPVYDVEILDRMDRIVDYIMLKLRIEEGIDKAEFEKLSGLSFDSLLPFLEKECPGECYIDTKESFRLTEEGLMVLDNIVRILVLALV